MAAVRPEADCCDEGRLRRLEALDELLPMLTGVLDIRDVFVRISEIAQRVLPHDLMGLPLVDEDREHAILHAVAGDIIPDAPRRVPIPDKSLLVTAWDHMLVDDTREDPMERDLLPTQMGNRSLLRLPLRLHGTLLGALDFYAQAPAFYRPSDVLVGKRIADHVVLALSHQRLAEERERRVKLQERSANLEMLDGLLSALTGVLSLRDVFDRVVDIAQKVVTHDGMAVLVPTDDPSVATVYALRGYAGPTLTSTRIREPETIREPWDFRMIADLQNDPIYSDTVAAQSGMQSSLALPVRLDGRLEAILTFTSKEKDHFTRDDVLIGRRIADHIALALSHERLAAEQHRSDQLRARGANLDMLDELLVAVTGAGDLPEVWDQVSNAAQKVLQHDALSLVALLPDGIHGRVYASKVADVPRFSEIVKVPPAFVDHPDWEFDLIDDLRTRDDQKHLEATERGFRAALRVPIRLDRELVAVLAFLSFTPGAYSKVDVPVARRISDRMVVSFARERRRALAKSATEANERVSRLESRVRALTEELDARTGYRRVVGESASWREVLMQATQVAATETTALLLGESGTGKEVVARFLHRASTRKDGPFVALNCAALPEQLLEAELFGYERGAFTGAVNSKPGQLEQAGGGTLFLDEVGEMSLPAQAKFLRVLQEREFQRLGGTRVLRTDARIVAATNRDLQQAIRQGQFREDLYYRLNVFSINLPPLRDRRDDILPLSDAFLKEIGRGLGRPPAGISKDARKQLIDYHWPGNVRELRNILERAAILCEGGLITAEHFALSSPPPPPAVPITAGPLEVVSVPSSAPPVQGDLQSMERSMIEQALKDARFNKSKAAKQLGLSRTQLYVRMRRYGLE